MFGIFVVVVQKIRLLHNENCMYAAYTHGLHRDGIERPRKINFNIDNTHTHKKN